MDSVIRGSTVAMRNANDAISLSQTATGALESLSNLLGRMRELATQSANASNGVVNSALLQTEFASLKDEVIRTVSSTKFNSVGTFSGATYDFQIGAGTTELIDQVSLITTNLSAVTALGTGSTYIIGSGSDGASLGAQLVNAAVAAANLSGATPESIQEAVAQAALQIPTGNASGDGVLTGADRAALISEIYSIDASGGSETATSYLLKINTVYGTVVGGEYTEGAAQTDADDVITGTAGTMISGLEEFADATAQENALLAMIQIDLAISAVNTEAATHGAFQNKLGFVTDNLSSLIQTTSAAKSRIMDTDFAAQTAQLSKYQILQQAGTAMLAQANQMGSNVLTLLK
jgi:flagellin